MKKNPALRSLMLSLLLATACGGGPEDAQNCEMGDRNQPSCGDRSTAKESVSKAADILRWNQPCDGGMYCASPTTGVNVRVGPGAGYDWVANSDPSQLYGICQVLGENVNGNSIWDYVGIDESRGLGLFISDYYMNTPSFGSNIVAPCGP